MQKLKQYILLAVCIAFAFKAGAQINKVPQNEKMPWKDAGETFIYSLAVPGTGYMKEGKLGLGLLTFGTEAALFGAGAAIAVMPVSGNTNAEIRANRERNQMIGFSIMGIAGALHMAQAIHATLLTHKSNDVNGYYDGELVLQTTGANLGLSYRF